MYSQEVKFGITLGSFTAYPNITLDGQDIQGLNIGDVDIGNLILDELDLSVDPETGIFIGLTVDLSFSDRFHLEPTFGYSYVSESSLFILPIMAKYYIGHNFNLQAGPQFAYSFEDFPDQFTAFGIFATGGLGYDIDPHFWVDARYAYQLNNVYTGLLDLRADANVLMFGVGYKF
jgi:opacity protein-like surface antigen